MITVPGYIVEFQFHYVQFLKALIRVSIRITYAERNATFFCAKEQQFAQSFAKVILRKIALLSFCETQVLRNSATRVLHNSAIKRLVTVCVS